MGMNIPKTEAEFRRYARDLFADLTDSIASESPDLQAALPEGDHPDFREHLCWRNLFVFPHKEFPYEPGEVVCQGCERRWRLEEESRP